MSIKVIHKKFAVILFAVLVLFIAFPMTVFAEPGIDIIYMANEHADEGDTINVTISTTGETSISTLGLRLYYDKEKLAYQRSQWTGNQQNSDSLMMLVSDVEYSGSQVLNISMISDGGYQSGSALVTLVFTVKEGYAENPFKLELREITDENLQSVKPAASIVYQNTENGSGEGTGLSGEVTLENDILTYGEPLSKLVFHDAAFVDSDNKAVDGSLAWKNPEEIPNAGTTSAIWVFTPSDSQYETLEGTISIIVNKAENAPNMPDSSMSVSNSIKKVGGIPLPEDWEWQEVDRDTALETDTTITAMAVYIGVDKGNYENETVMVAIKRLPCDHVYISKVTKEPTADVEGIMTYTCSKCGDTYTERIPVGLWISGLKQNTAYTGSAIKPEGIRVYHGSTLLRKNAEYTISYKNNTKAGTAQVIVTGKGNYKGKAVAEFTIEAVDLSVDSNVSATIAVVTETGKSLKPAVSVTWNGKKLKEKTDYTLAYAANIKTASAEGYDVSISGIGNYKGAITRKFRVAPKGTPLLNSAKVTGIAKSYQYQEGKEVPEGLNSDLENITVKIGKKILDKDDYAVRVENAGKVGTGTIVIEAVQTNICAGEKRISFNITGTDLKKGSVTNLEKTYAYTGESIMPEIQVYSGRKGSGDEIPSDAYTVQYSNCVNPGKATVIVSGIPEKGYSGSIKASYKIGSLDLAAGKSGGSITVTMPDRIRYAKGGAKPQPVIIHTNNGVAMTLREGVDYVLKYSNNTSVNGKNKPALKITGVGNYCGTITECFDIEAQDIGNLEITVVDKAYNSGKKGKYYYSAPKVYDLDGKQLKQGRDYTVQYYDDLTDQEIGKNDTVANGVKIRAEVSATETGCYTGTLSIVYLVRDAKDIKDIAKVKNDKITPQQYTGNKIEPEVGLYTMAGKTKTYLTKDMDYEIIGYYNNVKKGTATILIKGIHDYSGVKSISFKIAAADNSLIWSGIMNELWQRKFVTFPTS